MDKALTFPMRLLCAIVFCTFSFCYLYFYQADILAVEQHLLSGGKTHYDRTIGAVLITVALYYSGTAPDSDSGLCDYGIV